MTNDTGLPITVKSFVAISLSSFIYLSLFLYLLVFSVVLLFCISFDLSQIGNLPKPHLALISSEGYLEIYDIRHLPYRNVTAKFSGIPRYLFKILRRK